MSRNELIILGAGMAGLAADSVTGAPVFEAMDQPGGICSSYYVRPGETKRLAEAPKDGEAYRFELGGGHWIFGGGAEALEFIRSLTPVKSYARRSSVFFSKTGLYVPYPLQNHLGYLPQELSSKALTEMASPSAVEPSTMAEWQRKHFGETLTSLFFAPFHELYTAGLWSRIAPQDAYKSPVDYAAVLQGASGRTPPVGYNATFVYPIEGLNVLAERMAERCRVSYGKRVVKINVAEKEVIFEDGSAIAYERMVSTLPLNRMMEIGGLSVEAEPDPYTSVLVLNIGAIRGPKCPEDHWLYNPDAVSGFHRVGFYSNVDVSFLPASSQEARSRVSIYVERGYPGGRKPKDSEVESYGQAVVKELQGWGFILEAEVVDPTWVDVAYTWAWPGSKWVDLAITELGRHGIVPLGRYGRWRFQGIAESVGEGLGATLDIFRASNIRAFK